MYCNIICILYLCLMYSVAWMSGKIHFSSDTLLHFKVLKVMLFGCNLEQIMLLYIIVWGWQRMIMMQFHTVIRVPGVVWDALLFLWKMKSEMIRFDNRAFSDTCWLVEVSKWISMCLNMLRCEATSISCFKLCGTNECMDSYFFLSDFVQYCVVCNYSYPLGHLA